MKSTLQLFTAKSGFQSARILMADNSLRHLHSTVKPEAEAEFYTSLSFWGDVIVFAGIGLGYHINKKIFEIPSSSQIIVIEYYETLVTICMKTIFKDFSNDIVPITFKNSEDILTKIKKRESLLKNSTIQIIKHPASYYGNKSFYDGTIASLFSLVSKKRPNKKDYKKVLLLYGNFFLQEEIKRAIQEVTGQSVVLFHYERYYSGIEYESHLLRIIWSEKPDFVFTVNMKGIDGNGILSNTLLIMNIPLIVWFVDDPHPILLHQKSFINSLMIAFSWEKKYIYFLNKCGFHAVEYLPLATDKTLFSGDPLSTTKTQLGFVGSSMGHTFLENIRSKFLWNNKLSPVINRVSDIIVQMRNVSVLDTLYETASAMNIHLPFKDTRNLTWLCSYCIHCASMKKRKKIIGSLLPFNIELFGDPEGWNKMFPFNIKTNPDIDYSNQLCNLYRTIKININITSCQMPSAVNQRVFDIPMSGSFVITDNQNDLNELFSIGDEIVQYSCCDELHELISFYLNNDSARKNCIIAAQNRIRGEHLYKHRIQTVFQKILC